MRRNDALIAAWGNHGCLQGRADVVRRRLPVGALALGLTALGEPAHPLFLPASTRPAKLAELASRRTSPPLPVVR